MKLERKFGEDVEGYSIPVLNEREVRAAAGLFFVVLLVAATQVIDKQNFAMLKYSIVFFLFDFILRVLVNPRYAPSMILGRLLVKNQTPEYVGAPQKKFAWIIGLFLATVMFVHMVILNGYSPITGFSCMFCLIFLFFESAFGICLGMNNCIQLLQKFGLRKNNTGNVFSVQYIVGIGFGSKKSTYFLTDFGIFVLQTAGSIISVVNSITCLTKPFGQSRFATANTACYSDNHLKVKIRK